MPSAPALPPVSNRVKNPRYCYLETDLQEREGLHVACAGREECGGDYRVARRGFACFALEFVSEGRGQLTLDGKSWPLHAGMFFCYGPETAYEMAGDAAQPMTKFFVDFFGGEAAGLLGQSGLEPGRVARTLEVETARWLFEALIAEGAAGLGRAREICAGYLRILLLKTAGGVSEAGPEPPASERTFQRCLAHIDAHFASLHDLGDLAAAVRLRPSSLCRLFRKFGYPSPFHYLTRRKMNRAAELLIGEGCSVKETALELGFDDPYHFSRLFKSHFGHSPVKFIEVSTR